jgi:hypothetical protein
LEVGLADKHSQLMAGLQCQPANQQDLKMISIDLKQMFFEKHNKFLVE